MSIIPIRNLGGSIENREEYDLNHEPSSFWTVRKDGETVHSFNPLRIRIPQQDHVASIVSNVFNTGKFNKLQFNVQKNVQGRNDTVVETFTVYHEGGSVLATFTDPSLPGFNGTIDVPENANIYVVWQVNASYYVRPDFTMNVLKLHKSDYIFKDGVWKKFISGMRGTNSIQSDMSAFSRGTVGCNIVNNKIEVTQANAYTAGTAFSTDTFDVTNISTISVVVTADTSTYSNARRIVLTSTTGTSFNAAITKYINGQLIYMINTSNIVGDVYLGIVLGTGGEGNGKIAISEIRYT